MTGLLSGVALAAFVNAAQAGPRVDCEQFEASVHAVTNMELKATVRLGQPALGPKRTRA
jgi:hypothetical protein